MSHRTTRLPHAWACALCAAATLGLAASVHAQGVAVPAPTQLPSGGRVVAGQAQITQNAAAMTVQQNTLRAVINWQQFNLGSQAQIRFDQPSPAAVTLNRVVGADPTQIMGRISAPGQVFISNPQGVLFGAGASVDVGGLVATTMGIGTADFMAGQSRFDRHGSTAGVVNQGQLTAGPQGYIALLAPEVRNEGVITAQAGTVALAAGEAITLNFGAPGRLSSITVTPAQIATLVENRRAVLVEGGRIILAARSAEQLMGSVVNSGELNATSLVQRGGRIMLEGDDITLTDSSRIEARGTSADGAGGGTVLVGGDWQGSGDMHQATRVNMADSALIDVSATDHGDGGKAVLWADVNKPASQTAAHGRILARGGSASGNGGQVETSAYTLDTTGLRVDAGAVGGTGGLWLIDPADTTITQSIANGYAATLNTGTSVLNDVAGSIAWTSGVSLNKTAGGAATLTLRTGGADNRGIDLTGATIGSTSGPLNLVLWTRYNSLGNSGKVTITDSTVNTNGGSVWVGGGSATTWNGLTVGDERTATWTADEQGVMVRNSSIGTGAGSISMAGLSYATGVTTGVRNYGVLIDSGSSLTTTSGSISLSGDLMGRYNTGGGLWIGSSPIAPVAGSVGITSGSGAISLAGTGQDQSGSGNGYRHAMMLITNQAGDSVTVRSGAGAIALSGNATFGAGGDFTSDTSGIQLQTGSATAPVQVVSTSGAITLSGQNTQQASQSENALRFTASDAANNIRIGYDGSTAYSGNILIRGDSILQRTQQPGAGSLALQTTGNLVVAPIGASFTALRADSASALSFDNDWNFGSTLGGFTLGKAGNTAGLTLSNALTTAGPISLYGGSVTLNANLASTLAGAAILAKASGNIVTGTSRTLQTNGGAITLWSDSDANGGYIWLNQNATLDSRTQADRTAGTHTTGGGKVTLAGGADDGSGAPAGYAMGDNGNTDRGGINFGDQTASGHASNTQILSGGGDVLMRGKATNGMMGINWVDSGTLNAGSTGIVSLEGINTVSGHGIEFAAFGGAGNSITIRSGGGSSSTPAITFTGSGTGSGFNGIQSGRPLTVLATGAGGITVNGTAPAGWGYTGPLDFLAASGAIAINGGSGGIVSSSGGTLGRKAATPVTASSSNVTLTGDRVSMSGATTIDTSGTLIVQPSSASFSSALTWPPSNLSLGSSLSGLTVGKPGNMADITVGSTQTVAGPISIYGQGLTLNADLVSTLAGAPILLRAASAIVSNNTRTFQTNGGAITLWADSDNSGQGFILLNPAASPQSTTLDSRTAADRTAGTHTTGGGKIMLAGGADDGTGAPAGYAISTSSTSDRGGINFGDGTTGGHNNNTLIYSGGGDVVLRGKSGNGTMGINWVDSGTINAGSTGLISLNGVNTSTGHGIEFGAYAVSGSSIGLRSGGGTSSTPAISISGTTAAATGNGVQATRLSALATGAGGISVGGTTANTSGYGYTGPLDFLAASGPIGIDGGSRGINSNGGTLGRKAATAVTTSSSNVALTGGTLNIGTATTIDTTGTVTLQPSGTSFTSAQTLGSTLTLTGGVSGLAFGKPGNTADLTVASAQSIAGPISFYGGTVTINSPITETSSADTTLLMQAMTDIVVNGSNITSSNGKLNLVFITDWDSTNGGAIYVNGGTTPVTFTTRGGAVWLGGDGYAPAYSTTTWNGLTVGTGAATSFGTNYVQEGVNLKGTTITTSGGDVYVAGTNNRYNSGENRYGVFLQQGTAINTGSGNITVAGMLAQQTGTLATYPILLGIDIQNSSLQTTTGNIAITGGESATTNSMNAGSFGVRISNSTIGTTGATGDIGIVGTLGTNAGTGATVDGVHISAYGAGATMVVSTVGGNIAMTGTANTGNSAASNGVELATGQPSNTNANNPVVQVVSRTGNVSVTGDNPVNTNTGSTGVLINGVNYGKIAIGDDGTNTYSGNTTVTGRSVLPANLFSGYLTLGGSGTLTIQPTGNSFVSGAATGQSLDFSSQWVFGNSHSAITLGKDAGTAAKVDSISVSNPLTAAGSIRLYGGNLNLNANLTSTLAGAGLLTKASGNITSAASVAFQTNNGDLTLWSDSDASGAGSIVLGNSNTLNSAGGATSQQSGGGRITLAGGADGNADGVPDGPAVSSTTHGLAFGTSNASNTTVFSGGGDVLFKGRSSATSGTNHGVVATGALGITSGQGAIGITGDSAASYGVEFSNFASGTALTLNSAKTSGTAIAIAGTTTASSTHGLVFDNDAVENLLATGGGGIAVAGTGTGTGYGVWLQNTNVLASSGAIVIDGGANGINVASGSAGSRIGKSTTDVTSSSSNITLTGNLLNLAAPTTVDTTGTVTVQPSGPSFTGTQSLPSNLTLASSVTGLTLGKVGNTAGLSLPNAQAVAGPIGLYGGNIGIASTLSATAAGDVLIQASGTLTMGAGSRAQTSNGNVVASAARWVNQSGASALVAGGSGRYWQVWSSNADPFNVTTGDTRGSLAFDYKQYGAIYGASPVLGTGNGLLYSYQPTVTASLTGTVSKVYDGGTSATLSSGNFSALASGVDGDQLLVLGAPGSSAFASKDVGNGLTVTAGGLAVASATSSSATGSKAVYGYGLTSTSASAAIGSITQKALTANVAAPDKAYDGTPTAPPTLTIASGLVGSETLGVGGSASFNSKDVATANLVTVTGTALFDGTNGGLAGNYSLGSGQTVAASITRKALTATVAAPGKVYDGSTSASPTLTLVSGLVGSETLGVGGTATFDSKDVATASLVTVASTALANGTNGGLASNYSLAAGQTVASTITQRALVATVAAAGKAYDGTTAATPTLTIASGLVGSETVGASGTASFNTKDVTTANLVTVNATSLANGTNGGLAGNYSLAAGQTVASTITPKALTATVTAPGKVYDGNVTASPTLTVASGLVGSETLGVGGVASFNSKDVATANSVTVTGTALANGTNGGLAANYSLATGAAVAANITRKALTATVAAPGKVYDGSTVASPTLTIASGLVGSETVGASGVASFDTKDVATANLVTVTGTTLSDGTNGGLAGNYSLGSGQTVAASITPKALTGTVAAPGKVYDGSVAASPTLTIASGLVGSETLGVTGTANFNSKDVATADRVTVATTTLADGANGGLAGNYSLAAGETVASAITPKALTAVVTAAGKVYDGTTTAGPTLTLTGGLVGSETVGVTGTAAFNSKDVASASTVTVTGTALADGSHGGLAGNYTLAAGQTVAAVITPLAIGVTGVTADDKVYDAGTLATLGGSARVTVLPGDGATLSGPVVARFVDKNVGTGKAVGVTGYTLVGTDAANYALLQPLGLSAAIVPATLQLSGIAAHDKVYDATTVATLTGTAAVAALGADQLGVAGAGSASFADRNVGSTKSVVASGFTLTGADASNYVLAAPAGLAASITPATLSLAGAKVYDGSTSIAGSQIGASGVAGETFVVTGSGGTGNLVSRDVQAGQPLASVDGLALGAGSNGALAGNYLPLGQATSRIDVSARPLMIGVAPVAKVYDGTTFADGSAAVVDGSLSTGDRLSGGQFAFADPNAGSGKLVTASQVIVDDGNGGRNYSVGYTAHQAVGRITPAALTVTANDDAKFVTRTDGAGYNGVHYAGFVNGETAAVLGGLATVTRLGSVEAAGLQSGVLAPSGLSAANYDLRYANGSFTIVPAGQLLVRVANQNTTYGDGTAPGYLVTSAQYVDGNDVIKTLTPSAPVTGNTSHYSDGAGGQAAFTLGPVGGATSGAGLLKAGSYAVGATNVTETSVNFSDTLTVVGQLTVGPRALRPVLVGGPGKVYDGSNAIGPLQFSLPGAVGGDQLQTDGIGAFGSRNAGTRVGYTVDRVVLGGADAGNYVLQGGSFSGNDGVITPKPVTLLAPVATKVYDGQTGSGASAAELAALSAQLGVTGDAVRSVQVGFDDKNVGIGKSVNLVGAVLDDGNGGANYVLTLVGNSGGTITRLGSVTWTGGTTGNWFDAANWAGGAVPDLRNVAQVVIPAGVRVAFDDAAVPAIVRGPVFVESIGSAGALQMQGGELNVGPGGMRLADLSQSGGRLDVKGDAVLKTFAQSGGAGTVAGSFTTTLGYTQGTQGTLAVQGRVDLSAPLGDVVLGTLHAAGGLGVTTSGGAIRQATGTRLTVPGATVLDSGDGDIALGNDGNDFVGAVSARGHEVTLRDTNALTLDTVATTGDLSVASDGRLDLGGGTVGGALIAVSQGGDIVRQGALFVRGASDLNATASASRPAATAAGNIALDNDGNDFVGAVSARGNDVTLRDANALTLGTVTTTGDLSVGSHGLLDLGRTTVGGTLTAASHGGDIVQQGPLVVLGTSDLNAGAGAVRLTDPFNALTGAVVATASTSRITGRATSDTPAWLTPLLPAPFVSPTPVATPALDRAMGLELHVAMMWLDPSQRFAYPLPTEMIERVRRSGAVPVMQRADGRPLPEWLHFDVATMSLSAEQIPPGQLPMSLALWMEGERVLIRLASAAP